MRNESKKEYYQRLLAEEELILDFSEEVCGRLNELGRDKSWLQRKLAVTPGDLENLLNGEGSHDLRRVADIALLLGCKVALRLEPLEGAGSLG